MSDSKRVTIAAVASGALLSALMAVPAFATPQMVSQAKAAGIPRPELPVLSLGCDAEEGRLQA